MDAPPLQEQQRIMMAYNNMMHSGLCGGCARKWQRVAQALKSGFLRPRSEQPYDIALFVHYVHDLIVGHAVSDLLHHIPRECGPDRRRGEKIE